MTIQKKLNQDLLCPSLEYSCIRSEIRLWNNLKNKQLGTRFIRQISIGDYNFHFYCKELKLAIELCTTSQSDEDKAKGLFLEWEGIDVLQFEEKEVIKNLQRVVKIIRDKIEIKKNN